MYRTFADQMGLFKRIACAMGISRGQVRILVIGLDNSGKSTLVEHMKPKKVRWIPSLSTTRLSATAALSSARTAVTLHYAGKIRL